MSVRMTKQFNYILRLLTLLSYFPCNFLKYVFCITECDEALSMNVIQLGFLVMFHMLTSQFVYFSYVVIIFAAVFHRVVLMC